jgi:hypothetical protein
MINSLTKNRKMKLKKGLKVIHKFNGRVTTVNEWDDIGINPHSPKNGETFHDMFHGNFRKYTIWDKIASWFSSEEIRKA